MMEPLAVCGFGDVSPCVGSRLPDRGLPKSAHADAEVTVSGVTSRESAGLAMLLRLRATAHERGGSGCLDGTAVMTH